MSEYRVEKKEQSVVIYIFDQVVREGVVFLSPNPYASAGSQGVLDLLRERTRFLPFRDLQGNLTLINKEVITHLRYQREAEPQEIPFGEQVRVRIIFFGGEVLEGTITLDMPEGRNRLLDYINASPGFFAICGEDACFVANGSMVREISPC